MRHRLIDRERVVRRRAIDLDTRGVRDSLARQHVAVTVDDDKRLNAVLSNQLQRGVERR